MKFGLEDNIIESIQKIFALFPQVEEVILYGSRAKGNHHEGSDIDLTVKGELVNLKLLNKISLKLDDLLLPYIFDLSVLHQIQNTELLDHIRRVGLTFYSKNSAATLIPPAI